jgi:hypothetical protein
MQNHLVVGWHVHPFHLHIHLQATLFLQPNKLGQVVMHLICIWKVPSYSLSCDTSYSNWSFHGFSQFLQANAGIVPQIRPQVPASYPF